MSASMQHKLDRVRRPRVQITYDVETNGSMVRHELPFVVGVLADLSGKPKEPLKPLKERKLVNIDRDNLNEVMARSTPRLALKVKDRLTGGDGSLLVELNFSSMDDFEPARLAEQVEPLRRLLEARRKLSQLLTKMEGNDKLNGLLEQLLTNRAKAEIMAKYLGVAPGADKKDTEPPGASAKGGVDMDDLMKQLDNP